MNCHSPYYITTIIDIIDYYILTDLSSTCLLASVFKCLPPRCWSHSLQAHSRVDMSTWELGQTTIIPTEELHENQIPASMEKNIIRICQINHQLKKNKKLKLPGPRGETWTSKKLHHTFNTTAAGCTGEQGARSRWHLDRLHSPMLKHHARRFDHSAILSTVRTGLCIKNITRKPNQPKKTLSRAFSILDHLYIISS